MFQPQAAQMRPQQYGGSYPYYSPYQTNGWETMMPMMMNMVMMIMVMGLMMGMMKPIMGTMTTK